MRQIFYTILACCLIYSQCFAISLIGSGVTVSTSSCSGDYGYDTAGASRVNSAEGEIYIYRVSLGCNATVSSMSAYMQYIGSASSQMEFAIYSDNGSGTDPDSLLGNYGAIFDAASTTAKWITDGSIGEVITGSPTYIWVATQIQLSAKRQFYDDSGTGPSRTYDGTWGTWPATWPTSSDTEYANRDYSIYVTFD